METEETPGRTRRADRARRKWRRDDELRREGSVRPLRHGPRRSRSASSPCSRSRSWCPRSSRSTSTRSRRGRRGRSSRSSRVAKGTRETRGRVGPPHRCRARPAACARLPLLQAEFERRHRAEFRDHRIALIGPVRHRRRDRHGVRRDRRRRSPRSGPSATSATATPAGVADYAPTSPGRAGDRRAGGGRRHHQDRPDRRRSRTPRSPPRCEARVRGPRSRSPSTPSDRRRTSSATVTLGVERTSPTLGLRVHEDDGLLLVALLPVGGQTGSVSRNRDRAPVLDGRMRRSRSR